MPDDEARSATTLTIDRIAVFPIRVPLTRMYRGSAYRMTHRSTVIVQLTTREGIVGEAYVGDEDAALLDIESIITDEIAPKLEGQDALCVERCWALARPATCDILRDRRPALVACAGVDAAIWDAVGKRLGQPLWKLWGGHASSVQMIAIGGYYSEDTCVARSIDNLRALGVAGAKFKVGGLTPEEDAKRFREARREAGDDFILAADANQGWSTGRRDSLRPTRVGLQYCVARGAVPVGE